MLSLEKDGENYVLTMFHDDETTTSIVQPFNELKNSVVCKTRKHPHWKYFNDEKEVKIIYEKVPFSNPPQTVICYYDIVVKIVNDCPWFWKKDILTFKILFNKSKEHQDAEDRFNLRSQLLRCPCPQNK